MKKVRAAIVGYGNIGHYVLEALQAAPDFEIAGVVRRAGAENKPEELANYAVVKDIKELGEVDVAILCTPTRSVEKYAKEYLATFLFIVAGKHFDHLIAYVNLIIEITALQQVELPIQFGLYILVCHTGGEVSHNQGTVVAPDHIIGDIGCLGIVEEKTHSVLLVTFHFTGEFLEISYRTVQNGSLPHSVDAGEDIHIGTQIPSYIKAFP